MIKVGVYQHYKGPHYRVYGVCKHSETEESLVFYRSLYGSFDLWVRPLDMFCGTVEVNGKTQKRFTYLYASDDILKRDEAICQDRS